MAELFINDKIIPNIEVTNVIEGITKRKNTVKELADIDPEAYVIELRLNICPNDAIVVEKNKEGFLYTKINQEKCINCGLCSYICPINRKLGGNHE